MRVLITGHTGLLGHHISALLEATPGIEVSRLSRADWKDLESVVARVRPEVVIHSAACGVRHPRPNVAQMARFNVNESLRLFAASGDAHFVFMSTGLAYRQQGRPLREADPLGSNDPYASSKAVAEFALRSAAEASGRRLTVLRPFCFTGKHDGGDRLFPALLNAGVRDIPFPMSPGNQVRDYCAVEDVAEAIRSVILRVPQQPIEVFNIGSGSAVSLKDLVERVCESLGLAVKIQAGARPYAPDEPMNLVADTALTRDALGWSARTDVAWAVWQLARSEFPELKVRCPR